MPSFDLEVRKELVKAKVDLTAASDEHVGADYGQSMIKGAHKIRISSIMRMIQGLSNRNDKDTAALVGLLDPAWASGSALCCRQVYRVSRKANLRFQCSPCFVMRAV